MDKYSLIRFISTFIAYYIGYKIAKYLEFRSDRKIFCKEELKTKKCSSIRKQSCGNRKRCKLGRK